MKPETKSLHPDISRCRGVGCTLKEECRRWLSYRYSFNDFSVSVTNYTQSADGTCGHQIPRQ